MFQYVNHGYASVCRALVGERERWALWLPVFLGMGIGLYFALPFEPPLWAGWLAVGVFAFVAWAFNGRIGPSAAFALSVACAVVALGVGVAGLRTWWVAAPVISFETGAVSVSGQVHAVENLLNGRRVTLINLHIPRIGPDATPNAVRIKLLGAQPAFQPGDWLSVRANLRPPPEPAMPGAFDFQRQSYFKGLGGVGFAFGKVEVTGHAPKTGIDSLGFAFQQLRGGISQRVSAGLSGQAEGGIAVALMTGERGLIPKDVIENMRASGLAHLLAISGLHVGLVAGIVFFALRALLALIAPLAVRYPIKKWAAFGAILAAFGYALMAGATVPTQRAYLMVALVLLAVLFDRRAISMRLVAWAAMAILLLSPESLLGASFQMSFAAVVGLVAAYETLQRKGILERTRPVSWLGMVGRYVVGVALTTAIAGLATGFFAAYHFNRVADFGLAANLVAVPVTALWVMPWAVAAYALMPLGMEQLALTPMGWGINVVIATAHEVAHWLGAVSNVAAFPVWGLVLVAMGGLWLALWQGRWRVWGIGCVAIGLLSFATVSMPDVLIHRGGKLAAVLTPEGGYAFSTLTNAKFDRGVWLRRAGLGPGERAGISRWTDRSPAGGQLRCDGLGCFYRAQGRNVAFTRSPEALAEDCWIADILIADAPATDAPKNGCGAVKYLITTKRLERLGTHAIWLSKNDGEMRVETVNGRRGDRPWVIKAQRSEKQKR